jgi:acyl-lipid omega-6 desaturase (Delta-12 desaturase)
MQQQAQMSDASRSGSTSRQSAPAKTAREWIDTLARYREPSVRRSIFELFVTVGPLVVLWVLAWLAYSVSYWLSLALIIPAAGFMVRLFVIQHDCGHGSFFRGKAANDWTGRVLGVFTMTPYDVWRRSHALHHSSSGNLDRRGFGDIDTLTISEYRSSSWLKRTYYRVYRHPVVLFGIGPGFVFLLQNRLPFGFMSAGAIYWISAMGTNLAILAFAAVVMYFVGIVPFLAIHIPIILLASSIGVWLFYVQHQFEETVWAQEKTWKQHDAALYGSSYYDLPKVLAWWTAHIGIHHVHHLYSRIPYYRLPQVLRDHPELTTIHRLTLWESFKCARYRLWDDTRSRLVTFREARKL